MKSKRYDPFIAALLIFILPLCFIPCSSAEEAPFRSAQVRDISDRAYEPAVIELLDNAKDSIVISMYIIQARENGPVRLLIRDLEEALDRGVSVDIYLNTRFQDGRALKAGDEEAFDTIRKKGGRVFCVTPSTRMHDKLIVVDNRYVVIGSANWSVSALKDNYESVTLIDSPEYAGDMLVRVRQHTLIGAEPKESDRELFPRMLTEGDDRAMDAYLLLKAYAVEQEAGEYFISLEQLALDLGMPPDWSDTALRRQAIKTLNKLENRYKLIRVNYQHSKDAWVALRDLSTDTFDFRGKFLNPEYLSKLSQPAKFIILVKSLLEKEKTPIGSFTQRELSEKFNVGVHTVSRGLKEISSIEY